VVHVDQVRTSGPNLIAKSQRLQVVEGMMDLPVVSSPEGRILEYLEAFLDAPEGVLRM
jgi:hypothetical protein